MTDISLKSSNIFNTSIAIEVDDYMLIDLDNNKFKVFIDQGTSIMEAGSPDLPQLSTSIIIPDKSKMIINVSNSEYVDYNNVALMPVINGDQIILRRIFPETKEIEPNSYLGKVSLVRVIMVTAH